MPAEVDEDDVTEIVRDSLITSNEGDPQLDVPPPSSADGKADEEPHAFMVQLAGDQLPSFPEESSVAASASMLSEDYRLTE